MFFLKLLSLVTLINLFAFNVYAEQCNAPEMRNTSGFSCEQKWNYYHWLNVESKFIASQQKIYRDAIDGTEQIQDEASTLISIISFAGNVRLDLKNAEKWELNEWYSWLAKTAVDVGLEISDLPLWGEILKNIKDCMSVIGCAGVIADTLVKFGTDSYLNDHTKEINNFEIARRYLSSYFINKGVVVKSLEEIAKEGFNNNCEWYDKLCNWLWTEIYDIQKTKKLVAFYMNLVNHLTSSSLVTQNYNFPVDSSTLSVFQSPIAAMQGRVTILTQSGTGFTPDSLVEFHVKKPDGSEYDVQSVQIGSNGEFRIPYPSPANRALGTYKWWVVDSKKGTSDIVSYQILPANSTAQALHGYVGVAQLDPVEQPKVECLPDFVTTKSWLSNSSSKDSTHKVTFKAGDEAYAHGIVENQGCANSPKDIKVMFLISKGEHEDAHDKWRKVGDRKLENIKQDNLRVGAVKHESRKFHVPDKSGKYNIVVCADRTKEQGNGDGDIVEKHKSNNCSTEAVFTVLPNPAISVEEVKVDHKPEGSLDTISCENLTGWARDRDVIYPIDVSIYDGTQAQGKLVTTFRANAYREDVDNHAFYIPTPNSLKDNLFHQLYVYATDPENGSSYEIASKSLNPCDLPIKTKEFTISNKGNADLIVNSITPSTPAPWLTINPTSLKLSPTSSNKVVVKFDPKLVPDGQHVTYLNINSNDLEESSKMYPIKASGQGAIVDSDGDGYSDLVENEFNSNPSNPEDTPVAFKCKEVVIEQFLDTGSITLNIPNLAVQDEKGTLYFSAFFRFKPEYSYLDPTAASMFFELEYATDIYGDTCASATVSAYPDWKVHIPRALFNGESLWGDFDFLHKPFVENKKIVVRLNKFGVHLK